MWALNPRSQVLINGGRQVMYENLWIHMCAAGSQAGRQGPLPSAPSLAGGLLFTLPPSLQDVGHGAPPPRPEAGGLAVYCFRVAGTPTGNKGPCPLLMTKSGECVVKAFCDFLTRAVFQSLSLKAWVIVALSLPRLQQVCGNWDTLCPTPNGRH